MNDFKITEMYWYRDPRYAKDLKLIKCNDIVHYMLNREDIMMKKLLLTIHILDPMERDFEEIKKNFEMDINHILLGLRVWQKNLSLTRRKIAQELECNFLGSGDNVIPNDTIEKIKENFIREPENKFMGGALWQWKEPMWVINTLWVLMFLVVIVRIYDFLYYDFDEREQVLEYLGKIPPDVAAESSI